MAAWGWTLYPASQGGAKQLIPSPYGEKHLMGSCSWPPGSLPSLALLRHSLFSQSLIFAVVLASSRQTSVQRLGLLSKVLLVAAWHPHCRENRVALGFFSPLAASHIICLCCETLRLVLRRQPNRVAIAGQGWLRAHSGGDSFS